MGETAGSQVRNREPVRRPSGPGGAATKRDRFLSADEIRQVWRALDEPDRFDVSRDTATALRLILVTAARPGMVSGMVGSELRDLSGPSEHGPHWSLAAERMKAGRAFITPLSGLALELVRPNLKTDPSALMFKLAPQGSARSGAADRSATRHEPLDAARPAAHGGNDPRQGRLLARTDRRAARAHPKRRDGGLCAVGQVQRPARNGDGGRAGAARNLGRRANHKRPKPPPDNRGNNRGGCARPPLPRDSLTGIENPRCGCCTARGRMNIRTLRGTATVLPRGSPMRTSTLRTRSEPPNACRHRRD